MHELWAAPAAEGARSAGARWARPPARCRRCCRRARWDDGGPRMDPVPALGEHTDAILAELGLDGRRHPRAARGRGGLSMNAAHLPLRARQPARALRQGPGQRRRRRGARPRGRGRGRRQGRRRARPSPPGPIRPRRPSASASSCASTTPYRAAFAADLRLLQATGLTRVMLPKAESPQQVERTARRLPGAQVLALIESARRRGPGRGRGGRRRRDAAGLRHARLRARPRPRHRRALRRPGLRRQPHRAGLARWPAWPRRWPA